MATSEKRIAYLQKKVDALKIDTEGKYRAKFEKQARYHGNGVYGWHGITATDTAELFLLGVLGAEGVYVKD